MVGQVPSLKQMSLEPQLVEQRIIEQLPQKSHHVVCKDSVRICLFLDTGLQMHTSNNYQPDYMNMKMGPRHIDTSAKIGTESPFPNIYTCLVSWDSTSWKKKGFNHNLPFCLDSFHFL